MFLPFYAAASQSLNNLKHHHESLCILYYTMKTSMLAMYYNISVQLGKSERKSRWLPEQLLTVINENWDWVDDHIDVTEWIHSFRGFLGFYSGSRK